MFSSVPLKLANLGKIPAEYSNNMKKKKRRRRNGDVIAETWFSVVSDLVRGTRRGVRVLRFRREE